MKKRHKRRILASLVVIFIVVAGAYVWLRWGGGDEVNKIIIFGPKETSSIDSDAEGDAMKFEAELFPESDTQLDGNARLEIKYKKTGERVYTKNLPVSGNTVYKEISYDEFVVGNGRYSMELTYGDTTVEKDHLVDFVVEDIELTLDFSKQDSTGVHNYTALDVRNDDAVVRATIYCRKGDGRATTYEPRNVLLEWENTGPSGNKGTGEVEVPGKLTTWMIMANIPYLEWGSNSYEFTLTNYAVKEDCPYRTITNSSTYFTDAHPVAVGNDDIEEDIPRTSVGNPNPSVTVELDGTGSYDDSTMDMDGIIRFTWLFDPPEGITDPDIVNVESYTESVDDESDGEDNDGDGDFDEPGEAADGQFDGKHERTYTSAVDEDVWLYVFDNNGHNSDPHKFNIDIVLDPLG